MSDYFTSLFERSTGHTSGTGFVQPRLPSRFENPAEMRQPDRTDGDGYDRLGQIADELPSQTRAQTLRGAPKDEETDIVAPASRLQIDVNRAATIMVVEPDRHADSGRAESEVEGALGARGDENTHEASHSSVVPLIRVVAENAKRLVGAREAARTTKRQSEQPRHAERPVASSPDSDGTIGDADRAPVIRVSIGRIEVRAIAEPAQKPRPSPAPQPARQSLEDYLQANRNRTDR
jgi:hypothetical protein